MMILKISNYVIAKQRRWIAMFRKILFILLCLLFVSIPVYAGTNYFYDPSCATPGDGTGGDCDDADGDDAFDNIADFEAVAVAGDVLWMRNAQTELFAADLTLTKDGTAIAPIYMINWPRAAKTINADWTNGSTTVDNVDSNDIDREQHMARFVAGPDGFHYLITKITDSNTFIIDRPYAGTTAANENTDIQADDLPRGATKPADPNSWDSDGDDLPTWDGQSNAIKLNVDNAEWRVIYGINVIAFHDTTYGMATSDNSTPLNIVRALFHQTINENIWDFRGAGFYLDQVVFTGDAGNDNAQNGLTVYSTKAQISITNSAFYAMGKFGIRLVTQIPYLYLENFNNGVEVANDSSDIYLDIAGFSHIVYGRDVKLGGTNGYIEIAYPTTQTLSSVIRLVNYGKVLGAYKEWMYPVGTLEKMAVTSTNANKKLSDNVIEITPYTANTYKYKEIDWKNKVFESRKTYDAGTYNVKVWIYNDTGNTLNDTTFSDDILMRCRAEAGSYGDATTEYSGMPWIYSDEIDIEDAAVGGDDWDYLQCDSVVVDVSGSKIYCEVLVSTYDAGADPILIDPQTSNP